MLDAGLEVEHFEGEIQEKSTAQNVLCKNTLDYIKENYCDSSLSLDQIGEALGMHKNYISRFFKEVYGYTLFSYMEKMRIQKACELLSVSDMKIEAIAIAVGYTSGASFRRAFKKVKGVSPGEFRERER